MQIAKEKSQNNLPERENNYSKKETLFGSDLEAADMIGLSWIFLDYPKLDLIK